MDDRDGQGDDAPRKVVGFEVSASQAQDPQERDAASPRHSDDGPAPLSKKFRTLLFPAITAVAGLGVPPLAAPSTVMAIASASCRFSSAVREPT